MSEPAFVHDPVRIGIVSISDRASSGVYEDKGLPALKEWLVRALRNPLAFEAFLRVAVASGAASALDYAAWVGTRHPSDRMRLASFEAREQMCDDPAEADALWRAGEVSGSRMVAGAARMRRAML